MILVYKTSVSNSRIVEMLRPRLDRILRFSRWNFDLQDCDNILRIDTTEDVTCVIAEEFKKLGLYCEELK